MKAKSFKKVTQKEISKMKDKTKWIYLQCTGCGRDVKVEDNVIAVKCPLCTCQMVPLPKSATQEKSENPAGWKFMAEYVKKDGTVYHFGEEMPDLKGTLEPSDVEKIRQEQKLKRQETKKKKAKRADLHEQKLVKEFEKKKALKKKEEIKKQKEIDSKIGKTEKKTPSKKEKKVTNGLFRYEKFEEPRVVSDKIQIKSFIESEKEFFEHLNKRQISIDSISKIAKSSYAKIKNSTGTIKSKRRGFKVVLENGDTNIINISVK